MSQLAPFRLPEAPARTDLVAKYFRALGDPLACVSWPCWVQRESCRLGN
jgi:hypothetical protein